MLDEGMMRRAMMMMMTASFGSIVIVVFGRGEDSERLLPFGSISTLREHQKPGMYTEGQQCRRLRTAVAVAVAKAIIVKQFNRNIL